MRAPTTRRRRVLLTGVAAAAVAVATAAGMSGASGEANQIAQIRSSTAKYHNLAAATSAGYDDLQLCIDMMGEHYGKVASFSDGVLDATDPEVLVYEHTDDGLALVAVEYVSTAAGTVPGVGDLHYNAAVDLWVLHAWVWKHNPGGMYDDMNPTVGDCPRLQ
jgi:hypothetical protein